MKKVLSVMAIFMFLGDVSFFTRSAAGICRKLRGRSREARRLGEKSRK